MTEQRSQTFYKTHIAYRLKLMHSICSSCLKFELSVTHANTATGLARFMNVTFWYHHSTITSYR